MTIVIDSSITMAWVYADERTASIERILDLVTEGGALVPSIWRLEIGNAMQQGIRRHRIDTESRDQALIDLSNLDIAIDPETNLHAWSRTVEFSDRYRLTTYDACYLELAQRRGLALATLDTEMRTAGRKIGIVTL